MYFESNWSHKKGEKKKKRLGDWAKAFKHTVHPVRKWKPCKNYKCLLSQVIVYSAEMPVNYGVLCHFSLFWCWIFYQKKTYWQRHVTLTRVYVFPSNSTSFSPSFSQKYQSLSAGWTACSYCRLVKWKINSNIFSKRILLEFHHAPLSMLNFKAWLKFKHISKSTTRDKPKNFSTIDISGMRAGENSWVCIWGIRGLGAGQYVRRVPL